MSEQEGQDHQGPDVGDTGAASEAATPSTDPARNRKHSSSPLMEAAAQAAEQAHAEEQGLVGGDSAQTDESSEQAAAGESSESEQTAAEAGDAVTQDTQRTEPDTQPPRRTELSASEEAEEEPGPLPGVRMHYYGMTNVGLVRDHNEDNLMVADLTSAERDLPEDSVCHATLGNKGAVLAVCDGMGGAAAGEVASQMAVDTIYEVLHRGDPPADRDAFARRLVRAVEDAGSRIFSAAKMDRTRRGMGTTATVAGLLDKVLFVGQVGDSRAYVLRNGELGQITKDQSLVNQLIEAGQLSEEEAEAFEHSNIILQALGTTEDVNVDLTFLELRKGDRLMLCSDGLSGLVHPEMIRDVLRTSRDLPEACRRLIDMANAAGGHDNITVVAADFGGDDLPDGAEAPKPTYQQYPLPPSNEKQDTLPPRTTSMKQGGPKPGADVKRASPWEAPAPSAPRSQAPRTMRWWLLAAVLSLAFVTVMAVLSSSGNKAKHSRNEDAIRTVQAAPAPVPVTVTTDVVGAELYVDGKSYGPLSEGDDQQIQLVPGAYRLEARSDGSVAASANLTVHAGKPVTVELLLPSGRTEESPAEPAPPPPPQATAHHQAPSKAASRPVHAPTKSAHATHPKVSEHPHPHPSTGTATAAGPGAGMGTGTGTGTAKSSTKKGSARSPSTGKSGTPGAGTPGGSTSAGSTSGSGGAPSTHVVSSTSGQTGGSVSPTGSGSGSTTKSKPAPSNAPPANPF